MSHLDQVQSLIAMRIYNSRNLMSHLDLNRNYLALDKSTIVEI